VAEDHQPGRLGANESIRRASPDYSDTVKAAFVHQMLQSNSYSPSESAALLGNLQRCVTDVLAAYGDTGRRVWVADSFEGLPKPHPERFPAEAGDKHWTWDQLAVPLEEVKAVFERYGLLDGQVRFLPRWFRDTLPTAPIDRLAVLRLDGHMYGSTMDALEALYPKLSVGGYVIIDDYGAIAQCKEAVTDFRNANGIIDPIESIDWTGVDWQRLPADETWPSVTAAGRPGRRPAGPA
jgi:O-methyltransferase